MCGVMIDDVVKSALKELEKDKARIYITYEPIKNSKKHLARHNHGWICHIDYQGIWISGKAFDDINKAILNTFNKVPTAKSEYFNSLYKSGFESKS